MIYLEHFRLPPDMWVDWYFSFPSAGLEPSPELLATLEVLEKRFPEGIPQANKMTGFISWYPWKIFYQRGIEDFCFGDITILYGGNGSGKTTLLNVIAQKLGLHRSTLYNKSLFLMIT